ncbi:hypothetical protein AVME950_04890 [Acidovorax sp. SUPP950]|uniref:hypothetical protein n=1 Tax=Acidovorax sp. SUPP950 TaxID=511901 RepID=UPI0023CE26FB|nr:hypothetical protein [Acidovorax sp. SUPP950]GKS74196.1 hypothetical protein AVME950_04890 [Acidovorax sp. SUPP950]
MESLEKRARPAARAPAQGRESAGVGRLAPARRLAGGCLLSAAALLAGCAAPDLPRDELHAPSTQKTARAVQHWDVLARDVAERTAVRLRDWPPGEYPIYLLPAQGDGFDAGFRSLLVTRLVDRGITVSTQPTGVRMAVSTQVVQHQGGGVYAPPRVRLSEGVAVVRDASGAYVPAPDVLLASGTARTEILVTTSIESDERVLARTSDVYSIDQGDVALYLPRVPAVAATPVKTWRVVP